MVATSSPNQIAGEGGVLTEQAKLYRQRSSINGIFTTLRDRFGISVIDVRSGLQRLLRKENTPLQDHSEKTGTDRVQQPARNKTAALHLRRLSPNPSTT